MVNGNGSRLTVSAAAQRARELLGDRARVKQRSSAPSRPKREVLQAELDALASRASTAVELRRLRRLRGILATRAYSIGVEIRGRARPFFNVEAQGDTIAEALAALERKYSSEGAQS